MGFLFFEIFLFSFCRMLSCVLEDSCKPCTFQSSSLTISDPAYVSFPPMQSGLEPSCFRLSSFSPFCILIDFSGLLPGVGAGDSQVRPLVLSLFFRRSRLRFYVWLRPLFPVLCTLKPMRRTVLGALLLMAGGVHFLLPFLLILCVIFSDVL